MKVSDDAASKLFYTQFIAFIGSQDRSFGIVSKQGRGMKLTVHFHLVLRLRTV
jgi:hypothetical protein